MITKKIIDQAYELILLPHIKVHNVFHVNLLKKYVPHEHHILGDELSLVTKDGILDITPKHIVKSGECTLSNCTIMEHLVKCTRYPDQDATWEREDSLVKAYPNFLSRSGHLEFFYLGRM